jgi:ATP-dependent RNA helicase HelY
MSIRRELGDLEKQRPEAGSAAKRERRARQISALKKRLKAHPCHGCSDREKHARWAERWFRLRRETDTLRRQINTRTGAVAKVFDRVVDVLVELGYLVEGDMPGGIELASPGQALRRIYGERDLLVAECLRRGLWNGLDAPSLAALACCLVYEPRRDDTDVPERYLPRGRFREALTATQEVWSVLDDVEHDHRLPGSNVPANGLALAMYKWASGAALDVVLRDADLAAGDFVRWCKQTIDLLDQLSTVADPPVGVTARKALDSVRRGIVAYSSV